MDEVKHVLDECRAVGEKIRPMLACAVAAKVVPDDYEVNGSGGESAKKKVFLIRHGEVSYSCIFMPLTIATTFMTVTSYLFRTGLP